MSHNKSRALETFLFASELCHFDRLARLLRENPEFVHAHGKEGKTALHWAASNGRKDIADFLIRNGADMTAKSDWNSTPLHETARFSYLHTLAEDHKQVAQLLLEHHAGVHAKDRHGATPLHVAEANGSKFLVEILLAQDADVNAMTPETQRTRLEELSQEIMKTIPNPWRFPTRGKVHGFLGTGPIMIVAERPSTGTFGTPGDRLLYDLLEKLGAANAHLTDVIKSRGKVREPYPEDMALHRRIFDQELEIVQPRKIIALSQKVHDLLLFAMAGKGIKVVRVWHYSNARWGQRAAEVERQLTEALDES